MQEKHTLIRHRDIESWVRARKGMPAISREVDPTGMIRARLHLSFEQTRPRLLRTTPSMDDGMSPVSWTAWLAELDRQDLALAVTDTEFEFVRRRELN